LVLAELAEQMRTSMAETNASQMDLDEAAEHLGLKASFLQRALSAGLLQGERGKDGHWSLSRLEIEQGEEAEEPDARSADSGAASDHEESATLAHVPGAPARETPKSLPQGPLDELHDHLKEEVAYLRRQLDERDRSLASKDRLISEMAASLARFSEAALDRLPRKS
jgi:hypothetical protein